MSKKLIGKKVTYIVPGTHLQTQGVHEGHDEKGHHLVRHESGYQHRVPKEDPVLEHTAANMKKVRAAYDRLHPNGPLQNVYPSTSELTTANSSTMMANPPQNEGV